jgi:hypothetical protein
MLVSEYSTRENEALARVFVRFVGPTFGDMRNLL